ncbi:MAG: hypothetical protein E7141_06890 [Rikenellaceae bacterium]|nr:hypothetical protein [Rikenellaceae bacterium]
MNRVLLNIVIVMAGLLFPTTTSAQTIALGERIPHIKKAKWLNGNQPKESDFIYIEFIHSGSTPCRQSVERIYKIVRNFDNTSFVLISHQSASKIDVWVTNYINERAGVIVDDHNIRSAFGVNYAPYAVILDHKHRALWFGNPQLLDEKMIQKLTTK